MASTFLNYKPPTTTHYEIDLSPVTDAPFPVPLYTDEEYNKYLVSEEWTRKETDHLFSLCTKFKSKFWLVCNHWDFKKFCARSIVELMERYCTVCDCINRARTPPERRPICVAHEAELKRLRKEEHKEAHEEHYIETRCTMEKAKQEQEMELLTEKKPMTEVGSTAAVKGKKKKKKKMSMVSDADAEMEVKEVEKIPGSSGVKDSLKQPLEEDVLKEEKEKHMKPIESAADVSAQTQEVSQKLNSNRPQQISEQSTAEKDSVQKPEELCHLEGEDFVELMNHLGLLLKESEKTTLVTEMAKAGSDDYQNNQGAKKKSFRVVNTGKKMEDVKKKKGSSGVEESPMQKLKISGSKNNSKNIARSLKTVADASAQAQGGIQNENKKRQQQVSKPSNAGIKEAKNKKLHLVYDSKMQRIEFTRLEEGKEKETVKLMKAVVEADVEAHGGSQRMNKKKPRKVSSENTAKMEIKGSEMMPSSLRHGDFRKYVPKMAEFKFTGEMEEDAKMLARLVGSSAGAQGGSQQINMKMPSQDSKESLVMEKEQAQKPMPLHDVGEKEVEELLDQLALCMKEVVKIISGAKTAF